MTRRRAQCQYHRPVQQPGLFGTGQRGHELISLRSDGGVLEHGPSKVPLLHPSRCDRTAVHSVPQVGTNPANIGEEDRELKAMTAGGVANKILELQ